MVAANSYLTAEEFKYFSFRVGNIIIQLTGMKFIIYFILKEILVVCKAKKL